MGVTLAQVRVCVCCVYVCKREMGESYLNVKLLLQR